MNKDELLLLLRKFEKGGCSEDELEAINAWYKSLDKDNQPSMESISFSEQQVEDMLVDFHRRTIGVKRLKPETRSYRGWAAVLLAFLTSSILLAAYFFNREIQIEAGEVSRYVYLPDSSLVILAKGSSLAYHASFSKEDREICLVGQAYFDVTKDEKRPFIVKSGDISTKVLGTRFNVKAFEDQQQVRVLVEEGKVQVLDKVKGLAILEANTELVYNKQTTVFTSSALAVGEKTQEKDWKGKEVYFDARPLGQILRLLEERYGKKILVSDTSQLKRPITASFRGTESLEEIMHVLMSTLSLDLSGRETNYIIEE